MDGDGFDENRYAGWLGTVAARYHENGKLSEFIPSLEESRHRLAACAGTSTCHIVQVSLKDLFFFDPIQVRTYDSFSDHRVESRGHFRQWGLGTLQSAYQGRMCLFPPPLIIMTTSFQGSGFPRLVDE